jgi:hypothetical protein
VLSFNFKQCHAPFETYSKELFSAKIFKYRLATIEIIYLENLYYILAAWHPRHGALWQDASATAHIINLKVVSIHFIYLWSADVGLFEKVDSYYH